MRKTTATPAVQIEVVFPQHYIHKHFSKLNAGAVAIVVFCSFLGFIMLAGTAIDLNREFNKAAIRSGGTKEMESGYIQINGTENLKQQQKPSLLIEVLACFSVYTNFKKIFASRSAGKIGAPKDTLDILNGVRVMSIGWVSWDMCTCSGRR